MIKILTKYDTEIPPDIMLEYFEQLIHRIFKILPMREEGIKTLPKYIENLLAEVGGCEKFIVNDLNLLDLILNMEALSLLYDDDIAKFRTQVLRCTRKCKGILDEIQIGLEG